MERELAFLKRHGFVIAGIGLPLLLVAAFAVARVVSRNLVEGPRHHVVYSLEGEYVDAPRDRVCHFVVEDGRLIARWVALEQPQYMARPRVYRLDGESGALLELEVAEAGELGAPGEQREIAVAGLEGVRLDPSPRAPDGYEFETVHSGGGLFGEIFGGGSRGPRSFLRKSGRRIAVPRPESEPYSWYAPAFLGWVVPAEAGR